jgi:hypothetical protein
MINELSKKAHAMQVEKGFVEDGKPRDFGRIIALIHSELSEALEADREGVAEPNEEDKEKIVEGIANGNPTTYKQFSKSKGFEFADAMIRIMASSEEIGLKDLEWYITTKMAYNATRAHKHGKAY